VSDQPIFEGERITYDRATLLEATAGSEPFGLLRQWLDEAIVAAVVEPTAMVLATVDEAGAPHSRTVLLRRISTEGLVFFTNRRSAKGRELESEQRCSLQLSWLDLQRQIRVEGLARDLGDVESDEYHATRPRGSQIAAWASPQSEPIDDREALDRLVAEAAERFEGVESIPRPPFWGGYEVVPSLVEFWQGRPSRLHDRIRFRQVAGGWIKERLAP